MPLVVDLDGTLIRSDLLVEAIFARLGRDPFAIGTMAIALCRGRAHLKRALASGDGFDPTTLPYEETVLALIDAARADGRAVYLATASHERPARDVADHLGLFDGLFATSEAENLSGVAKARALTEAFGEGRFDYVGNHADDMAVWRRARTAYAIGVNGRVRRCLHGQCDEVRMLERSGPGLRIWLRALRVHQYAKNLLVFTTVVGAHTFSPAHLLPAGIAFLSFCAAASALYLVNDLVDLADDRRHPTKRLRPLASGALPIHAAVAAVPLLILAALGLALLLRPLFLVVLAGYIGLTLSYSFWLKRKLLIDVIVLALLYTIRIFAGSVATGIVWSEWLLTFSLFSFSSLALIKRYTELLVRLDGNLPDSSTRAYRQDDLPILAMLAASSGTTAVTVFALYLSSPTVAALYRRPEFLWLLCPILLYLLARALLIAHRRQMHDDPIVWALQDRTCRWAIGASSLLVALAI